MKSQNMEVLACLRGGRRLTPLEALREFGTFRLAARIWELRQKGYDIRSRLVYRNGGHVAEYWLVQRRG